MSTEWTQHYLRECVDDEIALALLHPTHRGRFIAVGELHQTTDLVPAPRRGNTINPGHSRLSLSVSGSTTPPHWRRSGDAALHLHVELGLSISHDLDEGTVSVSSGSRRRNVTEEYKDHPSKDAATMAAIVRAAIRALEARSA